MMEMAALVAVIIGISQVIKNLGIPAKFIPLFNLVLGVGLATFFLTELSIQDSVLQGLILGLSASGLYDQSKLAKGASGEES